MKWTKASVELPGLLDAHEMHYRLDGKKSTGILVEGKSGGLVFEYRSTNGWQIVEDLSRVEYLDESPELSTDPETLTNTVAPPVSGAVTRKKLEDLTDEDAIEIYDLIGGPTISNVSKCVQSKQLLTSNNFYNGQTNLPGNSWWKIFSYLISKGYYWKGSEIAGANSVVTQETLFHIIKNDPVSILHAWAMRYLDGEQLSVLTGKLQRRSQSPSMPQPGFIEQLRASNPYDKSNDVTGEIGGAWDACCDKSIEILGGKGEEGK